MIYPLHRIGIGRAHRGRTVKLLIADFEIGFSTPDTGELLRQLTLDPSRDYQPTAGRDVSTMSRHICLRCPETSQEAADGIRTHDLLHGNYTGHQQIAAFSHTSFAGLS